MTLSPSHFSIKKVVSLLFWLLLWQFCAMAVGKPLLLPAPTAVAVRLGELSATAPFWNAVSASLGRIFLGFLSGVILGCLLGVCTAFSSWAEAFVRLPMGVMKATPVASFVILALVWVQGERLSVFVSLIMVLPLIWQSVHTGLHQRDSQLLEMAKVYRLSPMQIGKCIYLPAVLPPLRAALQVALGFAWKSGIAGEVLSNPPGSIGGKLYSAKVHLDTVDLFAWTVTILLLSMAIEWGMVALLKRLEGGKIHDLSA